MSGPNGSAPEDQGSAPAQGGFDIGKLVAGGFTVVSTAIAIVGGITGAVSRFLRNNPIPLLAALILSMAAVGVSLAGSQLAGSQLAAGSVDGAPGEPGSASWIRRLASKLWSFFPQLLRRMLRQLWRFVKNPTTVSFILFSIAALITVYFLEQSLASSDRPRIASTWTQVGTQSVLSVTVQISDMKVSDTLNVSVRAVRITDAGDDLTVGPVVYLSQTGADAAGDGNLAFNVPLPSGYDALRVVANLGIASVTCNGTQTLTPASPSPTPIASSATPVPVTRMPDNTLTPIFSCVTTFAPGAAPAASPSPATTQ